MAENNAAHKRKNCLHRDSMFAAASIYKGKVNLETVLQWYSVE